MGDHRQTEMTSLEAQALVEQVRSAMSELRSYVPDYFARKWKHDEMIKETLDQLSAYLVEQEKVVRVKVLAELRPRICRCKEMKALGVPLQCFGCIEIDQKIEEAKK